MKLKDYCSTFRNILFTIESKATRTAGGLFIPSADFKLTDQKDFFEKEEVIFDASKSNLVNYIVVKAGKDCIEIKEGDKIIVMGGIYPQPIELEEGKYYSITEHQVIGLERTT